MEFNNIDINENPTYLHGMSELKNITEKMILECINSSVKSGKNTFKLNLDLSDFTFEDKSKLVNKLKNFINKSIKEDSYTNIEELLDLSLHKYFVYVFNLNTKTILKQILLTYINNSANTNSYFLNEMDLENIIEDIDDFLLVKHDKDLTDFDFVELKDSFYTFLNKRQQIKKEG